MHPGFFYVYDDWINHLQKTNFIQSIIVKITK